MFVECREYPICIKESKCPSCDGCEKHCTCEEDEPDQLEEELNSIDLDDFMGDDEEPYGGLCTNVNCCKHAVCESCYHCNKHCFCDMDPPIEISEFFDEDFEA